MACGVQPAAAAAALWPHLVPSPRRSAAAKEQPCRILCVDNFRQKLRLVESYGSISPARYTSSASSAEAATLIRPANGCTVHADETYMDSVTGEHIVISGYWTGPDSDDGAGYVEAILGRIA